MKKSLLLLLCAVILFSLNAQEDPKHKPIASPTVEVGGSFNMAIYDKSFKQSWNVQRRILYAGGVLLGVDFKLPHGVLMLQTGVSIGNHDFSYRNTYGNHALKSLNLDMPIVAGYGLRVSKSISLLFSTGVVIRNLLKFDLGYKSVPPLEIQKKSISGLYGALGFCYHASPNFILRVEPFFEYFWNDYTSTYASEAVNNMSTPIIGIRAALKYNMLKME